MNAYALTLVVVFWFPIAVITIYNLFWDIRFWQHKDYRFDRMAHQLRWDFALSHRRPSYTIAKVILFFLVLSFAVFPGALAPAVAILVAFALWVSEMFNIGEKLFNHRFPYLDPTIRNASMIVIAVVTLGLIPLLLSLYLLAVNPPDVALAAANLLPTITTGGVEIIPLTYIFLIFSTLLAIAYDLGSPVITAVLVLITSPLAWLEKLFYVLIAKLFLRRHRDLLVVAITGSYSKTTTREILEFLLSKHYQVATTDFTETSLHRIALSIITNLKPHTQVFIAEINAYSPGEVAAITQLLKPQIAILTGIDPSHAALFGNMERTLQTKSEIVRHLPPRSTVIYNGNDELLNSIAGKYDNNEIFYFTTHDPHRDLVENKLEEDNYQISNVAVARGDLTFAVHNQTHEVPFTAPAAAKEILNSLLGAIAAASEIGISIAEIAQSVAQLPEKIFTPELIAGDNSTLLINDERQLTLKGFKNLLTYLANTAAPQHIVVTSGIYELGKYKSDVYHELAPQLKKSADVVITYDQHLAEALQSDNGHTEIVLVGNIDELIYTVRTYSITAAAILLAGTLDPEIVAALRDE